MPDPTPSPKLEAGAYEVIRQRLNKHGSELHRRLDLLNADRKAEFGGVETALLTMVAFPLAAGIAGLIDRWRFGR